MRIGERRQNVPTLIFMISSLRFPSVSTQNHIQEADVVAKVASAAHRKTSDFLVISHPSPPSLIRAAQAFTLLPAHQHGNPTPPSLRQGACRPVSGDQSRLKRRRHSVAVQRGALILNCCFRPAGTTGQL